MTSKQTDLEIILITLRDMRQHAQMNVEGYTKVIERLERLERYLAIEDTHVS